MKKVVQIEGMMCQHCAAHVKQALEPLAAQVTVDLEGKCAVLEDTVATDEAICAAVQQAGYQATGVQVA